MRLPSVYNEQRIYKINGENTRLDIDYKNLSIWGEDNNGEEKAGVIFKIRF